ncbi:DUF2867 domain-containing protein [Aquimarina sp. 2201CG1-2-11]|uniref:DUF2867 domain-containing protein n=1 Tax=Aquimarina discodermiae TaxID=3231043 RepID=UPI0034628E01
MRIKEVNFPKNSMLSNSKYDYSDSFSGALINTTAPEIKDIGNAFFLSSPQWVDHLFKVRNKIVGLFGLKTGTTGVVQKKDFLVNTFDFEKGKRIGIFKIYNHNDHELILGENDKHLDFKVSLLAGAESQSKKKLTISTIVKYHNFWGKLYFFPVKPFHKIIVKSMLKKTIQQIENSSTLA